MSNDKSQTTNLNSNTPTKQKLQVEVLTPIKQIYTGSADSVTSYNKKGEFDILPGHAHFISIISNKIEIALGNKMKKQYNITRGLLQCRDNKVTIYVGI